MLKKQIKHIFYDLDHTLWDYDTSSRETLNEIYQAYELGKSGKPFDFFVQTFHQINEKLWEQFNHGEIDRDYLRTQRFDTILEKMDYDTDSLSISNYYISHCAKKNNLMPEVLTSICYLSEKYQLHILTNGFDKIQRTKLSVTGIAHYFEKIITADSIDVKKPYPEIFQYAIDKTGATLSGSLMIGDNPNTDIKGAKDFGMKAILYDPTHSKYSNADYTIHCHSELMKLL